MIEIEYVWDDRWDAIFHEIFQEGIESKRQGDLNGAVDIYFHNLEKYVRRDMLPVFPYAILLKALGKVLTLQGRFDHASTAYFFAADIYIYQNILEEINSCFLHLGCCERSFLSTTKGVQYLASLKMDSGISPGPSDSYMDLQLMKELIARGRKIFQEFYRLLYKGREMKQGRARDQELRNLIRHWIERYRSLVTTP